ncbi:LysR substrate-binding domain-containing protein [Sphingomonas oleivorans]|nr:LysR substrate-binding domain-containing protein [Sphingomonas oleivorans]
MRYHRLPLRGLAVFEAAARHGKFAGAAGELLMTQAGVSQHIAQLEADLGVELFVRRHRGVELTSAGAAFLASVEQGLKMLSDGVASARRHATEKTLHILTDIGFAAWWLMPRIAALSELMPDVEVRLITTQSNIDSQSNIDAELADFDLAVLFGHGDWPGCKSARLFAEEVYPVCSPSYLGGHTTPMAPAEVGRFRLLHLRSDGRQRWFAWDDWFTAFGDRPRAGQQDLTLNNYQLVLQAALLGQGVALGWAPLIDELIGNGSLVRLTPQPLTSARGYHIIEPLHRPRNADVATVKAWLATPSVPDALRATAFEDCEG